MIPRDIRDQSYSLATTWEDAAKQIKEGMSEGYVLTSIAYGDITNHSDDDAEFAFGFFIIMSKAPGWKDPQMIECPRKPGLFSLKKSLTKIRSRCIIMHVNTTKCINMHNKEIKDE